MKIISQQEKELLDYDLEDANHLRHRVELYHHDKMLDARFAPWIAIGFSLPWGVPALMLIAYLLGVY